MLQDLLSANTGPDYLKVKQQPHWLQNDQRSISSCHVVISLLFADCKIKSLSAWPSRARYFSCYLEVFKYSEKYIAHIYTAFYFFYIAELS